MNNQALIPGSQIIPGSLSAIARHQNQSLAQSWLSVEVLLIVDVSGSMLSPDAPGGRKRYDVAVEELKRLQAEMPGKIGVVAFSDSVQFCPSGHPTGSFGNTNMAHALEFVKPADDTGVRFILISDGVPDSEEKTLSVARTFKTHIDTIYIGPERDQGGREFLKRLAEASGGQFVQSEKIAELAAPVLKLLESARR